MEKFMKNYKTALLVIALLVLSGCSEEKKEQTKTVQKAPKVQEVKPVEVKKEIVHKQYTIEEIYNTKCIECHATDGSGNTEKLTPTMIGQSLEEITNSLTDIEDDKGHIVMEHNREKIVDAGMEYGAKDMATYMYNRFNK